MNFVSQSKKLPQTNKETKLGLLVNVESSQKKVRILWRYDADSFSRFLTIVEKEGNTLSNLN